MATTIHFASVPTQYAPKRKMLDFAKPKWHNKLGEFVDPDVMSWLNNIYQDKVFPTRQSFNEAYDTMGTEGVCWRNRTMVLSREDIENFEEEFNGGAFEGVQSAAQKTLAKMRTALETGEKVIFVY
jgi:hypothetical protein